MQTLFLESSDQILRDFFCCYFACSPKITIFINYTVLIQQHHFNFFYILRILIPQLTGQIIIGRQKIVACFVFITFISCLGDSIRPFEINFRQLPHLLLCCHTSHYSNRSAAIHSRNPLLMSRFPPQPTPIPHFSNGFGNHRRTWYVRSLCK